MKPIDGMYKTADALIKAGVLPRLALPYYVMGYSMAMAQIEADAACDHSETEITEPHLAGARRCKKCGRMNNPNKGPDWFYE